MRKPTTLLVLLVALLAACSASSTRERVVEASEIQSADAQLTASLSETYTSTALAPLRMVVLVDRTGSITEHHVGPVEVAHFERVLDLMVQAGGEMALGSITDESNRPLLPLYLSNDLPKPPIEPNGESINPFDRKSARRRFTRATEAWRQTLNRRFVERRLRVDACREAATVRLQQQPKRPKSAIRGGLQRVDQFLSEPTAIWQGAEPHQFALLITDGLDNIRRPCPQQLPPAAELLIVNGSGSVGVLSALNPIRFESHLTALENIMRLARP